MEWKSNHVEVSTIRGTEEENTTLIRLIKTAGEVGEATFSIPGKKLVGLWETDLQGRRKQSLMWQAQQVQIEMKPWQVRTLLLEFLSSN